MSTCSSGWPSWHVGKAGNRLVAQPQPFWSREFGHARMLKIPGRFLLDALQWPDPPVSTLGQHSTDYAAGPDQLIRREQTPCFVAIDDAPRNHLARHRRVVQPMGPK